jgi:hypothetical protein
MNTLLPWELLFRIQLNTAMTNLQLQACTKATHKHSDETGRTNPRASALEPYMEGPFVGHKLVLSSTEIQALPQTNPFGSVNNKRAFLLPSWTLRVTP